MAETKVGAKDLELGGMGSAVMNSEGSRAAAARRVNSTKSIGGEAPPISSPPIRRQSSAPIIVARRVSSGALPGPRLPVRSLTKDDVLQHLEGQESASKYVEHLFTIDRLAEYLKTDINNGDVAASKGLSQGAALSQLKSHGPNVITPPARVPLWLLFLLQFTNFFMLLLIFAGLLSIVFYIIDPAKDFTNLVLGMLLLMVVLFTCYETYSQEAKSDELMEKFRAMVPLAASCIRDGELTMVKAEELVIGDIICLANGDKVPADCRIIETKDMKVDQSMITGESDPVMVSVNYQDADPLESKNIIFSGSLVIDGSGLAVVIRTGDQTLIGSMVELTGDTGKVQSTLKSDVEHAVYLISTIAAVQAVAAFLVGVLRGIDPITAFVQGFIGKIFIIDNMSTASLTRFSNLNSHYGGQCSTGPSFDSYRTALHCGRAYGCPECIC